MQKEPNRPRRKTRVRAKSNPDSPSEFAAVPMRDAAHAVIEALRPLSSRGRERVIAATAVFFGVDLSVEETR